MLNIVYLYVLFYLFYKEYGVRCYGFYGISYYYVVGEVVKLLGKECE